MVDGKPWMQVRYMRHPHSLTPLIPLFFCQSAWWAIKAYSEFRYYCLLSFVFSSVRNELGLWRQTGLVSNPGFAVSRGGLWGWNNLWASASSSVKWALTYRSCPQTFLWHWKLKLLVTQLLQTLCNPMDCSPPGSSVQGILQARTLEWIAIPFSQVGDGGNIPEPGIKPGSSALQTDFLLTELPGKPEGWKTGQFSF